MDFSEHESAAAFAGEVRALLAEHLTPELRRRIHGSGTHHDWALHRAIGERGWIAESVPEELGGRGKGPERLSIMVRELELAGAPYDGTANTMLVAFTLGHLATDWQRGEVLAPLFSGEAVPCLGYSEPESGSDVAAASTTALRDGDEWVINGQKMFTSLAEEARWAFLLARTNPEVAKHKGLTFFLVPMDSPGVSVTPIYTLGGKRTNITFYDDVRIPDRYRVGEVDGGWQVMLIALAFERGIAGGVSDLTALYRETVDWALATTDHHGRPMIERAALRRRLVRALIDSEVAGLLGMRAAWAASNGIPGQEGAEAKLFGTEAYGRASRELLDALGPEGLLTADARGAPADGAIEASYRYAPVLTVAGGTSEIQKNLIAERTLGLPRRR